MADTDYIEKAVKWVKRKSHVSLKANMEGYEKPKTFKNVNTDTEIIPDVSFEGPRGSKNYTEIALKQDDHNLIVNRWKLLSSLASIKNGTLYLLAPRGHKSFTERIVEKHNIDAKVHAI